MPTASLYRMNPPVDGRWDVVCTKVEIGRFPMAIVHDGTVYLRMGTSHSYSFIEDVIFLDFQEKEIEPGIFGVRDRYRQ